MSTPINPDDITEDEVNEAQQKWCDGLISISREYTARGENGNYRAMAEEFIDDMYDFSKGRVFFRPTLAMVPQNFRTTRQGAISYFVGGDPDFPDDKGFIKLGWISADYHNEIEDDEAIQIHGNIGIAMGNVYLRNEEVGIGGRQTIVDKLFVFQKRGGEVRLIVHNSAATNMPKTEEPEDKQGEDNNEQ